MKPVSKLLECTLRDGSYAVDFQFNEDDTAQISGRLDALGFPLIEIGHGIGLGASEREMGAAAASDLAYMQAASRAVKHAQWGMFCIPGVAKLDHIALAADQGMGFIRIGTEVSDVMAARPYYQRARDRGLFVFANLMKSYTYAPADFAVQAQVCLESGAQCIYIVDSAGGMLPSEIGNYIDALRANDPDVLIGFHGHNNIGMGVANALYCVNRDLYVVDCSLQGIGRSSGNTPTEQLLAAIDRSGYNTEFDLIDVMQAGEELVRPLLREVGFSSLDVTAGLALFHSSYMGRLLAAAKENRVDPRRLMLALCRRDRVNAPTELIAEAVREVQSLHAAMNPKLVKNYFGEEQS